MSGPPRMTGPVQGRSCGAGPFLHVSPGQGGLQPATQLHGCIQVLPLEAQENPSGLDPGPGFSR